MSGRLRVRNYRGVDVPAALGLVLAAFAAAGAAIDLAASPGPLTRPATITGLASALVCAAGLVDDVAGPGPRGLRGHLRALAAGQVSTGILKLFVTVGAAAVSVASLPHRSPGVRLAGVVLLAAAANLWNGFDVRPARALKTYLVAALATVSRFQWGLAPVVPSLLVGAIVVLPWDAGERAMLGDSGSNLLGFAAGIALYLALPGGAVLAAAIVAVALTVVAETLTLSRAIDAVAPLRWFDRLGRRS